MPDLNDVALFIKVAQMESFSRAAQVLGMPVSTLSRKISELEASLEVTLLQRTTRKLALTTQGRDYFNECLEPLNLLSDAERVLTQQQKEPEGLLRLSVPIMLGTEPFLDFLSTFLQKYPRIKIELFITNTFVDLIAENIDVSIRFGNLSDSSLIAKKLGTQIRYLVAAPAYLLGRVPPTEPEDLRQHQCILMNAKYNEDEWEMQSGGRHISVRVSGPISSRDFLSVSTFVYQGHGIGFLPPPYCDEKLKAGELVRILPDWVSPSRDLHVIYPTRNFLPSRLQTFLAELAAWKSPLWSSISNKGP